MERWKRVPGFKKYLVSSRGRVYSKHVHRMRKLYKDRDGYCQVLLYSRRRKQVRFFVHRLMWLAFRGPIPDDYEINHKNGRKGANRLGNLECVTASENVQHAFDTGLKEGLHGSTNPMAVLCERDIRRIRKRIRKGEMQKDIAADYGISRSVICSIHRGRAWVRA